MGGSEREMGVKEKGKKEGAGGGKGRGEES